MTDEPYADRGLAASQLEAWLVAFAGTRRRGGRPGQGRSALATRRDPPRRSGDRRVRARDRRPARGHRPRIANGGARCPLVARRGAPRGGPVRTDPLTLGAAVGPIVVGSYWLTDS